MDKELLATLSNTFSLTHLFQLIAIFAGAMILQYFAKGTIQRIIRQSVRKSRFHTKQDEIQREDTLTSIVYTTARVVIWTVAFLLALGIFDISVGPLLAGAGIAGVALGFGAQTMVKDFLAGIFILAENQYRIGDVVEINQTVSGTVQSLSLRMTSLRDLEGRVHYIANGTIQVATNLTMEYANVELDIGVDYTTDVDRAEKVIGKVGLAMKDHEEWKDSILEAPYMLRLDNFGESALILKILCKTAPGKQWAVKGEFLRRLKKAFEKEGISIARPQMVVHTSGSAAKQKK